MVRRFCKWLHLWMGLLSGSVVVIVCLTGALYVFKDEITTAREPWRFVEPQAQQRLSPDWLLDKANAASGESAPAAITMGQADEAVRVDYRTDTQRIVVYLNPYHGQVTHISTRAVGSRDFFDFLLQGHRSLWLPRQVGCPIVAYSVLIFFLTLITGIIIWWPKRWSRQLTKNKLTFHRPFRKPRLNFDLHNVLGFYALLPLLVACFTGLLFGLDWFSQGIYRLVSGGNALQPYALPAIQTDTTRTDTLTLDVLHRQLCSEEPDAVQFYYALPRREGDVYRVSVVHEQGSYYKQDNRYFHPQSGEELTGQGPWAGKYRTATPADKMMRMNLDIHEGRILGWWGKLLMCLASLTGASLPITGFILWRRRVRRQSH